MNDFESVKKLIIQLVKDKAGNLMVAVGKLITSLVQ